MAITAMRAALPALALVTTTAASPQSNGQYPAISGEDGLAYPKESVPGYDYTSFTPHQQECANSVIEQLRFAWTGYYTHAFPHDDLLPLNNSFTDSRNSWGLTAIDGLDTAIIMEQVDIVNIILDFIPTIDFTKTNAAAPNPQSTSVFETTIRYLGGLLGAYDLLKGPFAHLACKEEKVEALLIQARTLADTLKFAFETPTGIPVDIWQRFSHLSGDPSYGELAQRSKSYWFNGEEIWPGLTGGNFSVETGEIIDQYGGWRSGNDSAYEYLIKMYVYDNSRFASYRDRWVTAAESTIAHLLSHPTSRPDLTMAAAFTDTQLQNYSEGLACFIGGNFILASTTLDEPSYLEYGLKFSEFCANGYRYAASGIGPILYSWNTSLLATANYTNQTELYERAGWFIPDNTAYRGGQAPEAVESSYYAYRATGDPYWRDVAWAYTLAQNKIERVGSGFGSVNNVLAEDGNGTLNFMASFMLAEVLKYQYLIQRGEEAWEREFVFNTEAHPLRVVGKDGA